MKSLLAIFIFFLYIPNILSSSFQVILSDSTYSSANSTLQDRDSRDSVKLKKDLKTTVFYTSRDTQIINVLLRTVYLKGKAKVVYGDVELEAEEIFLNWGDNTVRAYGVPDSTGKVIGLPIFRQRETIYNAKEVIYNFQTEKGKIREIITQQGEGYLHGVDVKKTSHQFLYIRDAVYTTCNLEEPHYGIRSKKLKVTPGKSVISGPFFMEFSKTPFPLGFIFGLFPISEKRTSGIILPVYGESREQGFYLRNGGFYFNLGEYVDLKIVGNIYTFGSWGIDVNSNYKLRYKFGGNLAFALNKSIRENTNDLAREISNDFRIKWSHRQITKKSTTFSANVNLTSSDYNRNNSFSIEDYIRSSSTSNINYQKKFLGTPFSLGINIRQNQNFQTDIVEVSPNIDLSMNRIYPFKKVGKKKNPFNQLNFSYTGRATLDITNDTNQLTIRSPSSEFTFIGLPSAQERFQLSEEDAKLNFYDNFPRLVSESQYGATHRIPISTNITLFKYFNFSPSFNYTEHWYPRKFSYLPINNDSIQVTERQEFSRAYQYSTSAGFNTRVYLFMYFKGGTTVRSTTNINLNYSYQPNFGEKQFGFYEHIPKEGREKDIIISRFLGTNIGIPPNRTGKTTSLNLSVDNFFELKIRAKKDSTGKSNFKKIPLLRANLSYNFSADSFELSNINISTPSFNLLKNKININIRAVIDPYTYELLSYEVPDREKNPDSKPIVRQRRINQFAWQAGNGIGRLRSLSAAIGGNFKASERKKQLKSKDKKKESEFIYQDIQENPEKYVDFNIPWDFRFNYTLSYEQRGFEDSNIRQTLTASGNVSLTPKWKVGLRTGWDFEENNFSVTSFNIFRDLHCWQMSLSWIPFGLRQSYEISIGVKSSLLQDLKYQKRNSWRDR